MTPYRFVIVTLCLLLSATSFKAQQTYPIYVTPSLTPPYSLTLSDYSQIGSQRLVVTIMVRDVTVTNLPVRLNIRMETTNGVTIETIPTAPIMPIYLTGGEGLVLFGDDLKDYFNINNLQFKGYSKEEYRRTGQLPEGFYRVTVEVHHFATGRLISNRGVAIAWMALGKPPILKTPDNKAEMGQIAGMPMTFSWLPSNVGVPNNGIQYTFDMWEMRVPGIDPNVIAASMPVFYSATQMSTSLVVQPAMLMLEPGMNYAWRVTASDVMGQVQFAQGGRSEVRTFVYQCRCDSVTGFNVERRGQDVTYRWTPSINNTSFNIEMQNPVSGWSKSERIYDTKYEFKSDTAKTYRARVQAVCQGNEMNPSDFTSWRTVTIPAPENPIANCPDCDCRDAGPEPPITNFKLRTDLRPGDTIQTRSGRSRFIIKSVIQQGEGVYKGQFLSWIEVWGIKFLCDYKDLKVNTDNQILAMNFESVSDPTLLVDVDAAKDYLNQLGNAVDIIWDAASKLVDDLYENIKTNNEINSYVDNFVNDLTTIINNTDFSQLPGYENLSPDEIEQAKQAVIEAINSSEYKEQLAEQIKEEKKKIDNGETDITQFAQELKQNFTNATETANSNDDEKKLYQMLYNLGTDAFVFCKKCESTQPLALGESKLILKGQAYKCVFGKISSNGTIEAKYPEPPTNIDGTITINEITTNMEQFIITFKGEKNTQLCEAKEEYNDYCSLEKAFDSQVFNQKVLRDIAQCVELPDISKYKVNTSIASSTSQFNEIKEAIAEKLANSFFGNVKLCVELSSSYNEFTRLTTSGIDCASAEIKLGIHIDYENNKVLLNIDTQDGYLKEYVGKWQEEARRQGISVDVEELRKQVISDLESSETTLSFFEKLNQNLQSLLSNKIASFVEGVQVSQKIAKNVWSVGEINRSTWHSSDGEHNQWPQYAQFHPVVGGVSDGVIGEIVGIPVAIKSVYGLMTDAEQRQAFTQLFTSDGVLQMVSSLKEEAKATISDEDRLLHFSSQTVVQVASAVSGFSIISSTKIGDVLKGTGESLKKFLNPEIAGKIDKLMNKSKYLPDIKSAMKDFFKEMDPKLLDKLAKIDKFDDVIESMAQGWRKFHGEKFVFENIEKQGDDFVRQITSFEARIIDNANHTADIVLQSGKKLEYKSWKKSTFDKGLLGENQAKNQLKSYIQHGDFEYIVDAKKILNDGVPNPNAFVKGEFQKVFKASNYEIFEDFFNSPKMKETLFKGMVKDEALTRFKYIVDNADDALFIFIKVE